MTYHRTYIVEISHLNKRYKHSVLTDINLKITQGEIVGLLGMNGSGKTTLIKILVGLLRQYSGEVQICGQNIGTNTKAMVAFLPDRNIINPHFRVFEALEYFTDFFVDFNKQKALDMLDFLQISQKQYIKSLSKGNIEKLHLALTLAREAKLYIFDEPIAGVDVVVREYIFNLITRYRKADSTVIIATHLLNDVQHILDKAILIHNGKIYCYDTIQAILSRANTESPHEYLGNAFIDIIKTNDGTIIL